MNTEVSCGIIVFDDNKVLLIKHKGGHTSFPKGHVEKGETFKVTAKRETKEETGIDSKIICNNCFINTYVPKEGYEKDVLLFIGKRIGGELKPQLEEVSFCDFFTKEEAIEKLTYDIDKEILEEAYEIYNKISK